MGNIQAITPALIQKHPDHGNEKLRDLPCREFETRTSAICGFDLPDLNRYPSELLQRVKSYMLADFHINHQ